MSIVIPPSKKSKTETAAAVIEICDQQFCFAVGALGSVLGGS
jgi:hypothetical protein